ncbi:MAG: hypothetical protein AB3N28_05800 [Kordiimonas sp.]
MRVTDGRSLFGAAALIITGVVLGIIAYPYYQFDEVGEPVKRGRWVWEILMNLQVLCLAFMWYCYTDKIKSNSGKKATLMRIRMLFSLISVLLPFAVIMTSVMVGWFNERPPIIDTVRYTYLFSLVGFTCSLVPYLAKRMLGRRGLKTEQKKQSFNWRLLQILPGVMAFVVVFAAILLGQHELVIWLAPLCYMQSAIPYLKSGFRTPSGAV